MSIKISNLEIIEQKVLKRLEPIGRTFKSAIEAEKEGIRKRTQQGIDVDGRPFEEYSSNQRTGRNWKDVRRTSEPPRQIAFVDLTYSKDMFKAFKAVIKRDGFKFLATIFFDDAKQAKKAKGHHTGQLGNVKFEARKFFGLSRTQQETIVSKIRNAK